MVIVIARSTLITKHIFHRALQSIQNPFQGVDGDVLLSDFQPLQGGIRDAHFTGKLGEGGFTSLLSQILPELFPQTMHLRSVRHLSSHIWDLFLDRFSLGVHYRGRVCNLWIGLHRPCQCLADEHFSWWRHVGSHSVIFTLARFRSPRALRSDPVDWWGTPRGSSGHKEAESPRH